MRATENERNSEFALKFRTGGYELPKVEKKAAKTKKVTTAKTKVSIETPETAKLTDGNVAKFVKPGVYRKIIV